MQRLFPADFRWGATICAHAVEGADFNSDWWRWEQRPGRIAGGGTSEIAADHWHRRSADYALARKLGMNALLVGISWARLQPAPGEIAQQALQEYQSAFEAMQTAGITPFCMLYENAAPAWFTRDGAWTNPKAIPHIRHYAARMAVALGRYCRHWIPLYEPAHGVEMAFCQKQWPGGEHWRMAAKTRKNLLLAQQAACTAIKENTPGAETGITLRGVCARPADPYSPWDLRVARALERRERSENLDTLANDCDFIGVSYYGVETVQFAPFRPKGAFYQATAPSNPTSEAFCLLEVLKQSAAYGKPLYITGNGIATEDDRVRCTYLLDHLALLHEASEAGIPVQGYFHRALLDGFEWEKGYTERYGLIHVDRTTLARTPNPSAYLFKEIAESGTFRPGVLERFCPGWQKPKTLEQAV